MKSNSTLGKIALKTTLFICLFNLTSSSILLKNHSEIKPKQIREKYPENILAKTESRKLLVNLWNKDPHAKATRSKNQKLDFFGTTPDHMGKITLKIINPRTWNQNHRR